MTIKDLPINLDGPVFFILPEPAMAIGLDQVVSNFHVICLKNLELSELLRRTGMKVYCLQEHKDVSQMPVTSRHLLSDSYVQQYLKEQTPEGKTANLLFFKLNFDVASVLPPSLLPRPYRVFNNPFSLSTKFENKISFSEWVGPDYVPKTSVGRLLDLDYDVLTSSFGSDLVVQLPTSHAGEKTYFVGSESSLVSVKQKYPQEQTQVRVMPFIKGRTLTVNACCVPPTTVLVSYPFLQLTGLVEFTPYEGGTCGTVWKEEIASGQVVALIKSMTESIGQRLLTEGFRGFFGLDFIVEEGTDKVFLIECNPRLTASVSMFTQMELLANRFPLFAWHLQCFLPQVMSSESVYDDLALSGKQLVLRNTGDISRRQEFGLSGHYKGSEKLDDNVRLSDLKSMAEAIILRSDMVQRENYGKEYMRVQSLNPDFL